MTITDMFQKIGWGLEDLIEEAKYSLSHASRSRGAKIAAATVFSTAAVPAIIMQYNCAGEDNGGGGGGAGGAKKTDDPKDPVPGDNPTYNWEDAAQLPPFYSYRNNALTDAIGSYGTDVDTSYRFSMTKAELLNAYLNDANFNAALNNMYRPVMLMLNPNLTGTQADSEVENLIKSLTNNDKTDLQNGAAVFYGYVQAGKGYFALFINDQQGNPSVLVAVDGDPMAANGVTPITNVTPLADFIVNDPGYGGF